MGLFIREGGGDEGRETGEPKGSVFVLAAGNLKTDWTCSVHFITLLSSRGLGVCRSSVCGQRSAG